jgi:hypothetical protein
MRNLLPSCGVRIADARDALVSEFVLAYDRHLRSSLMARSPATPDASPARSSRDRRARLVSSEREEIATPPTRPRVLERAEMPVDTSQLARFLIGKLVVRTLPEGVASGRIVENEAYDIGDPAGHAYRGMTPRNKALFLERGHAYVYLAYGVSFMLNVSSETLGVGAGVLIRAIEPVDGLAIMQRNRGAVGLRDLTRGPGRSTSAGPDRSGSDPTVERPTKSDTANGSASRARPTVRCDSTFAATGSSAVRWRSTDEKSNALRPVDRDPLV